jgi:hypothetical protein
MNASELKDLGSTIAGGGAGMGLLLTVRWELIPWGLGEPLKVAVALVLIAAGYAMYGKRNSQ